MPDITIKVQNISKTYKMYDSKKNRFKESFSFGKKNLHQKFHALNNISFDIKKGETLGIVGKNGSGKSTLLKIITGVISPSTGKVTTQGKISSLLELGAGLNPNLSGIENIEFKGTLWGLSRKEIEEKKESIINFSELGNFIYAPIKSYSSGMYVRLAFSMAIHVDPDILIIDEALAVGDEAFQKKCYDKILNFQKQGKTILFVTHNTSIIPQLCSRAILLNQGELVADESPKKIVSLYHSLLLNNTTDNSATQPKEEEPFFSSHTTEKKDSYNIDDYDAGLVSKTRFEYPFTKAQILNAYIKDKNGKNVNILHVREQYQYCFDVIFHEDCQNIRFGMMIKNLTGIDISGCGMPDSSTIYDFKKNEKVTFVHQFECLVSKGFYFFNAGIIEMPLNKQEFYIHRIIDALMVKVVNSKRTNHTGLIDLKFKAFLDRNQESML